MLLRLLKNVIKSKAADPSLDEQLTEMVNHAHRLYWNEEYDDAEKICHHILLLQPSQFDALYLSGLLLYRKKQWEQGKKKIQQAVKSNPEILAYDVNHPMARREYLRTHNGQPGPEMQLQIQEICLNTYRMSRKIDCYVVSYPKCGRTWLRSILGHYLTGQDNPNILETFELTRALPDSPAIEFTHDGFPNWIDRNEISHDKRMYRNKKIVFLARDPRDVMVSSYFHYTKRNGKQLAYDPDFDGSISEFLHHHIGGIASLVDFYNIWAANRTYVREFHLLRYEEMHSDTIKTLQDLFSFLGLPNHGEQRLQLAIENSSFDRMRKKEKQSYYAGRYMEPPKDGDPEGFKVRRGKISGYKDYLSAEDINYLNDYLEKHMDSYFNCYL
jgi:hypothetical protein